MQKHLSGATRSLDTETTQLNAHHVSGDVRAQTTPQLVCEFDDLLVRRIGQQLGETRLRPRQVAVHRNRVHTKAFGDHPLRNRVQRPLQCGQDSAVEVVELPDQSSYCRFGAHPAGGDGVLADPHHLPRGADQRPDSRGAQLRPQQQCLRGLTGDV